MRIFGLLGLLVALVTVGLLVKSQFTHLAAPALPSDSSTSIPAGTANNQRQQIPQQYKQAIDAAMQPSRKMPDDN
jgi:hypothetical protein